MQEQASEIITLLQAARYAEVEQRLRERVRTGEADAESMLFFAISVHYQGRVEEVLDIYAELTRRHPDSGVHWGNYATALHETGRMEEAEQAFRTALERPPVQADTLLNLGLLLLHKEAYVEARAILRRAHAQDPASAEIALAAAKACNACGDYRTDQLLDHWREWLPLDNEKQLELARLLLGAGQAHAALELAQELHRRIPDNLQVMIQLANIHERINRLADAEAVLSRIDSGAGALDDTSKREIAHQRAALAARKKDFARAKEILLESGPRHDRDFDHYFELAGTLDKLGEVDAVMNALSTAHALQTRKIQGVAPQIFESDAPILHQASGRVSQADYAAWSRLVAPESGHSPVFVVGFPRSGTTLLEQMLDAHPRLQSMDERPFFNLLAHQLEEYGARIPEDLGKLSQRDCDELRKGYLIMACGKVPRQWDAQLVDKNPLNMLWMPMIHRLYPKAKWILAVRHPCDVVLSCYMQSFRANVLAAACADLERLARAYVAAMENWLHHVNVFKPDVFISRYEDLISDTPGRLRQIAQFVGVEDAEAMLRFDARAREKGFIATPSYTQVVEPVSTHAKGRWLRYRKYFAPVLPILGPMIEHWGYSAGST